MSNIASLTRAASAYTPPGALSRPSAGGELEKLKSQLSDWVNCPSCTTSAGKAKIAEITDKIETIKAQARTAEDKQAKEVPPVQTQEPSKTVVEAYALMAWHIDRRACIGGIALPNEAVEPPILKI